MKKSLLKRVGTILLALSMFAGMTACGGSGSSDSSAASSPAEMVQSSEPASADYSDVNIGVIFPIGGLGDNSAADDAYKGLINAQQKLGFNFDYSEPVTEQDREAMILEYSEAEEYDLIVAISSETLNIVKSIQPDYPDQKYLVYDIQSSVPNTLTEWFNKTQIGFMAGVFMALMEPYGEVTINGTTTTWTPSGKFGLVIGGEYPSTVTVMTGAAAGIKYIDPSNEYMYGIVGGWTDQSKNKELALSMYSAGCNFVFHNSGAGSAGVLSAAEESGKFMIGYDANQNYMSDTNILASSHKNSAQVMERVLTEFCESGGELNWGGDEGNDYSNGGIAFTVNDGVEIPAEMEETFAAIQEQVAAGEIDIPTTWDEVEQFTAVYVG